MAVVIWSIENKNTLKNIIEICIECICIWFLNIYLNKDHYLDTSYHYKKDLIECINAQNQKLSFQSINKFNL